MKYAKYLVTISLLLFGIAALAQHRMDSAAERAVRITQGPAVVHNDGSSATLEWTTDREAANRVQYRRAGSHEDWRKAFHEGGSRQHSMQLTGLRPGDSYEYEILTRDGDVRTRGEFRAEGHDHDRDRDHDHDHDHDRH